MHLVIYKKVEIRYIDSLKKKCINLVIVAVAVYEDRPNLRLARALIV